jgi:subtilisin family serine protease
MRKLICLALAVGMVLSVAAQTTVVTLPANEPPKNWFNLDPVADQVNGVSTEKAYALLQGRTARTVIVAVIDSGIDIDHEDLKGVIWVNKDEIPGNGIDDDNNGYIDDIHGWNFLGGKDGRNVDYETLEVTRLYRALSTKFADVSKGEVSEADEAQYALWLDVKAEFEEASGDALNQYSIYEGITRAVNRYNKLFEAYLDTDEVTYEKISKINSKDAIIDVSKRHMMVIYEATDESMPLKDLAAALEADLKQLEEPALYSYNLDFNPRDIVGDNPDKLDELGYGNNDVKGQGTDNFHGTHVAGIIAASRGNGVGMDGVAGNVQIMALRAVPNGDERDKDVANAIRYAVDNGARVINMSFGKGYSPNRAYVSEAIAYAADKGVLLVHAAGNSALNTDKEDNFPNDKFGENNNWDNWIEVGASSWGAEGEYIGGFSNYGRESVDLFAPGVAIYSTAPENNYQEAQGTSMASPVVAGVAAMLLSYFPELGPDQLKDVMMRSVRQTKRLKVAEPGSMGKMVNFSRLSVSGGIVNAYEAAKLAMSMDLKGAK